MQVSRSKIFQGLSLCLILSIFVNTLTSCNNDNSQVTVEQETEELTLVPETEVATQMPTIITLTSEPTKTQTPEPTKTNTIEPTKVIKEKYPIDVEKLHTMPSSYEDVVANPEKYQQSPDFFGDTKKAMEWWNNVLIPAMGDQRELEPNVFGKALTQTDSRFDLTSMGYEEALLSDYPSFYFFHDNELFLVPIFTSQYDNGNIGGTFAVILYVSNDGYIGNEGLAAIKNMAEGKKILNIVGIKNPGPFNLPDSVKSFIEGDYNWDGLEEYAMTGIGYLIGVGAITTISN